MNTARQIERKQEGQHGFTLVELMVTIVIIAVLISLLLPAIAGIRRAAMRNRAASRAMALVNAIEQYRHEYSRWPGQTQGTIDITYDNLAGQPHGTILNAITNNPRNIWFGEIGEAVVGNAYLDPWDRPYVITMDYNGNGTIEMNSTYGTINVSTNPRTAVGIMSWGSDPSNITKRIYTWIR